MARTVVPSRAPARQGFEGLPQATAPGDKLPDKLVKYVPAETLAFLVPISAQIGSANRPLMVTALVVSAAVTIGYFWVSSRQLPTEQRPMLHFYILSVAALICWALGALPNVATSFGVSTGMAQIVLSAGIFIVPIADGVLENLLRPQAAPAPIAGG